MPFVTPVSLVSNEASLIAVVPGRLTAGMVTGEPPLKCYVTDSCPRLECCAESMGSTLCPAPRWSDPPHSRGSHPG
jgi:hypothetical protein